MPSPSSDAHFRITASDHTKAAWASVQGGMTATVRIAGAVAAAVGAAAGGALLVLTKRSLESADALAKTADKLGINIEALAGLRYAASLAGVENSTLDKGLQTMVHNIAAFADGAGEAKDQLALLGFKGRELAALKPEEQFAEIAERMLRIEDNTTRVNVAYSIFGSRATSVLNIMSEGRAGIEAATEEARRFGLAISRLDAAKIEAANDAMTRARAALTGIGNEAAIAMAPWIMAVAKAFADGIKASGGWRTAVLHDVQAVVTATGRVADKWREVQLNQALAAVESNERTVQMQRDLVDLARSFEDVPGPAGWLGRMVFGNRGELEADLGKLDARLGDAQQRLAALAEGGAPSEALKKMIDGIIADADAKAQEIAARIEARRAGPPEGEGRVGADLTDATRGRLGALRVELGTEEDAVEASYHRRNATIRALLGEGAITRQSADDLARINSQRREDDLTEIIRAGEEERANVVARRADELLQIEGQANDQVISMRTATFEASAGLLSALGVKNKGFALAALVVEKGLGIASVLISAHKAAMAALSPPPIGLGPVAGAPLAASMEALGAAQAALIGATGLAQAFGAGGGGGFGGGGAGGASGGGAMGANLPAASAQESGGGRTIVLNFMPGAQVSVIDGADFEYHIERAADKVNQVVQDRYDQRLLPGGPLSR